MKNNVEKPEIKMHNEMLMNELKIVKHFADKQSEIAEEMMDFKPKKFEVKSIKDADELISMRRNGNMKLF